MELTKVNSRYSKIQDKNRNEEIVLLQGNGCFWKKCRFCDYYLDTDSKEKIIELNNKVLKKVDGSTGWLTIINSGSYFELPKETRDQIIELLIEKNIKDLTIEAHYKYKNQVKKFREYLKQFNINLHVRIGIETFDDKYREDFLLKGMGKINVSDLKDFDECCLLYGLPGQSKKVLLNDLEKALENFDSVYLNIYENRNGFREDKELIQEFTNDLYPKLKDIKNLHILINNTDLGVG